MSDERQEQYSNFSGDAKTVATLSIERDPDDVLTISHLLRALSVLVILLFLSCGLNFYLTLRKADLIVVDKTSGRTLLINDKDYGQTEAVQLSPDNLTNRDKRALVTEFFAFPLRSQPSDALGERQPAAQNDGAEFVLATSPAF